MTSFTVYSFPRFTDRRLEKICILKVLLSLRVLSKFQSLYLGCHCVVVAVLTIALSAPWRTAFFLEALDYRETPALVRQGFKGLKLQNVTAIVSFSLMKNDGTLKALICPEKCFIQNCRFVSKNKM